MNDEREGLPSASEMGRIAHCAGSSQLIAIAIADGTAMEDDDDPMALRGDAIHLALSRDDLSILTDEEQQIATRLRGMREKALAQWKAGKPEGEIKEFIEHRMWIRDRQSKRKLASAKVDIARTCGDAGFVLDYKSGFKPSPPSIRNYQVRTQVVAFRHEFPHLKTIRGSIASYAFSQGFDGVDYNVPAMDMAERELLLILWRSAQPDAPRTPGPWCRYCKARGICVEATSYSLLPVAVARVTEQSLSKDEIRSLVGTMIPEQLAFVKRRAALIRNILDAVDHRLKAFSDEELKNVGFRRTESDGDRFIKDLVGMFHALNKDGMMTNVELFNICEVTMKSLEGLLVPKFKAQGIKTKKEALELLSARLEPFIDRKAKSQTLVDTTE